MCGVSDIPDWTWCEGGLPYLWGAADPATLDLMWTKSPISHVNNVTAPVYLMIGGNSLLFTNTCRLNAFSIPGRAHDDAFILIVFSLAGKNDLRVPPSQGYEYYHALKVALPCLFFFFNFLHFFRENEYELLSLGFG